jgi:hypothetical protein
LTLTISKFFEQSSPEFLEDVESSMHAQEAATYRYGKQDLCKGTPYFELTTNTKAIAYKLDDMYSSTDTSDMSPIGFRSIFSVYLVA